MKLMFIVLMQAALVAACAPWPPQSAALTARAEGLAAPTLLPQDQMLVAPNLEAEAAGAALAARAAALKALAADL